MNNYNNEDTQDTDINYKDISKIYDIKPTDQENKSFSNQKNTNNDDSIKIAFLGGVQEIGRSCAMYMCGDSYFLIDVGIKFKKSDGGFFYQYPDFYFIKKNIDKIKGIVITHSHEDHIGGVLRLLSFLNKALPIYIGRFGAEFLKLTLEHDYSKASFKEDLLNNIFVVKDRTKIQISDDCRIGFTQIQHTTPTSFLIYVKYKDIKIVHTGDWKFDLTPLFHNLNWKTLLDIPENKINNYFNKDFFGVDALISDSTRVEQSGFSSSESLIIDEFEKLLIANPDKRIIISTFASNATRLISISNLAAKYSKKVFLFGFSMKKNIKAAMRAGLLKTKHIVNIKDNEKVYTCKSKDSIIFASGPQGDENGTLYKIADGKHKTVKVNTNDIVVFSADIIPGNEDSVNKCIRKLLEKNITVIHRCLGERFKNFHSTGHGYEMDTKLLMNILRPKIFIPVHGDYRQMYLNISHSIACGVSNENAIMSNNGEIISISKEGWSRSYFNFVNFITDENGWEINEKILEQRKAFAINGFFMILIDQKGKIDSIKPFLVQDNFKNFNLSNINNLLSNTTGIKTVKDWQTNLSNVLLKYFNCSPTSLPSIIIELV